MCLVVRVSNSRPAVFYYQFHQNSQRIFGGLISLRAVIMSRVDFEQAPEAPLVEDVRAGGQLCSERGLVVSDRYAMI
ncbi:Transcription initiation factor IIB [Orchesella cincta]|uniref:Transcription initiation factor IIB n=1 Tax=Orchesella cincta TaxID=48709 RepID=A0A1D2M4R2_ORCCI|nr:Transcription initiation factor IIB [Orchesella cincta]